MIRAHVLICGGTGCTSSGSKSIQTAFDEALKAQGLSEEVKIVQTGCFGLCALGPVVIVHPDGTFYSRVTPEDVKEIVSEHLLKGQVIPLRLNLNSLLLTTPLFTVLKSVLLFATVVLSTLKTLTNISQWTVMRRLVKRLPK